jgi:DNA polymerase-3 subunit epsilon
MARYPEAIKIHSIRPADLKNAPRFPTILPKVKDFAGDSPIVAHAYKDERDFLDYEFARAKMIPWGESAYADERYIVSTSCGPKGVYPPAPRSWRRAVRCPW